MMDTSSIRMIYTNYWLYCKNIIQLASISPTIILNVITGLPYHVPSFYKRTSKWSINGVTWYGTFSPILLMHHYYVSGKSVIILTTERSMNHINSISCSSIVFFTIYTFKNTYLNSRCACKTFTYLISH